MSQLVKWNPLKYVSCFDGMDPQGEDALEELYLSMSSLQLPVEGVRASAGDSNYAYLSANGKLAKLTLGSGISVNPLRSDSPDKFELGYIYRDPIHALGWLLCALGFGSSTWGYEKEALLFFLPSNERPLRLSFDVSLTTSQVQAYTKLTGESALLLRERNPLMGRRLIEGSLQ